jgi:DTW domain-containing protein YfiP
VPLAPEFSSMDLQSYLQRKENLKANLKQPRPVCWTCRQAGFGCFCEFVRPFDSGIHFVILIHPIEVKRRIATGRMAHLCLKNSTLIEGQEFSDNLKVREIASDKSNYCVVLYPGRHSVNLSSLSKDERSNLAPPDKKLVVFVIDGTWNTAGRMIRSRCLRDLPTISFDANFQSRFRVRRQPAPECLSTIEAIHETIDQLQFQNEAATRLRDHDNLLTVFDQMVKFQLRFTEN